MAQVLCRFLWSLVSRWLKAICQFDPPVETMAMVIFKARLHYVATIWPNQCHLAQKPKRIIYRYTVENWQIHSSVCFLISCTNISDWGNLWVQLSFEVVSCTAFTFAFTATMHGLFVFFCMFASFAGLLHVVSQEAAKSRVENVRAFARDVHAFGSFFWFNSEKAWVKYCLAQHLWKKGPNRWSERQIGR